ncbi:MAG TPA: FAD-binding oxidoreductase [Steroidobacter sp.]
MSTSLRDLRTFKRRIDEATGREAVLDSAQAGLAHLEDARGGFGRAAAFVAPRSTEEISLILRVAAQCGVRLIPQGANTGLVAAGVPDDPGADVVLSLRAMNGPPSIDPKNRTACVEAGVLLSKLNAAAAPAGLCFPIDLAADPSVGGLIATNAAGAKFLRYGDVRRNLLGLEVVLADGRGTVLDLMKPLWKNNTGLDLKQLFVGTSGSLGVITKAVLALHPLPTVSVAALLVPADDEALLETLVALECSAGGALSAFEGMSRAAMQAAIDLVPSVRNPFRDDIPELAVLVELSGGPGESEERLTELLAQTLSTLDSDGRARIRDVSLGNSAQLWTLRHAIPEALRKRGKVIGCDISVARGRLPAMRARLTEVIRAEWPHLEICDFGHVGDGGLHFNLVWPESAPQPSSGASDAIRTRVFEVVVQEFDGSFSAEHGIGPRNVMHYHRFTHPTALQLSACIQRVLAPAPIGRVNFAGP